MAQLPTPIEVPRGWHEINRSYDDKVCKFSPEELEALLHALIDSTNPASMNPSNEYDLEDLQDLIEIRKTLVQRICQRTGYDYRSLTRTN